MAYHFIGIKGTGMAALACILHDEKKEVAGSDIEKYIFTEDGLRSSLEFLFILLIQLIFMIMIPLLSVYLLIAVILKSLQLWIIQRLRHIITMNIWEFF